MNVLYIGQLNEGGTCIARYRTLQRMGLNCIPFNVTPFGELGTRLNQSLMARFQFGRGIKDLNAHLLRTARDASYDFVWIDKGVWVYPETLNTLRSHSRRAFAVHYTPDPQLVFHKSRYFRTCIPEYDLLATTKAYEIDLYKAHGAKNLILVLQGYGPQFDAANRAFSDSNSPETDLCFVGHCERHYATCLKAAVNVTSSAAIWGRGWPAYAARHKWATPHVRGDGVWNDDYPRALMRSKIALGLLSRKVPDTTTTRTFEIPATATFMLAERNEDHLNLFEEGKEAEFFSTASELRDKIRFYLANDAPRNAIAAAGRERCIKSGYSAEHQLRRVLDRVYAAIGSPLIRAVQRALSLQRPYPSCAANSYHRRTQQRHLRSHLRRRSMSQIHTSRRSVSWKQCRSAPWVVLQTLH